MADESQTLLGGGGSKTTSYSGGPDATPTLGGGSIFWGRRRDSYSGGHTNPGATTTGGPQNLSATNSFNGGSTAVADLVINSNDSPRFYLPGEEVRVKPKVALSMLTLLGLLYTNVIGSAFGSEDAVGAGGACMTIIFVLLLPFIQGFPLALSVTELSTMIPTNAGFLMWFNCAFHPAVYFTNVLLTCVYIVVDTALYPSIFAEYTCELFECSDWTVKGLKVALLLMCGILNAVGIELVGVFSVIITLLSLLPFYVTFVWQAVTHGFNWHRLFTMKSDINWGVFLPTISWNISGLEQVGAVAEEVVNPQKTIFRTMFPLMGLVWMTFIPPVMSSVSVQPETDWSVWHTGYYATAAQMIAGDTGKYMMVVGGIASALGLTMSNICCTSRTVAGMGKAGAFPSVINSFISYHHPKAKTPVVAMGLVTSITCVIAAFLDFHKLVGLDQVAYSIRVCMIFIALVRMRIKFPDLERPYKIPLSTKPLILALAPAFCYCVTLTCVSLSGDTFTLILGLGMISFFVLLSLYYVHFFRKEGFAGGIVRGVPLPPTTDSDDDTELLDSSRDYRSGISTAVYDSGCASANSKDAKPVPQPPRGNGAMRKQGARVVVPIRTATQMDDPTEQPQHVDFGIKDVEPLHSPDEYRAPPLQKSDELREKERAIRQREERQRAEDAAMEELEARGARSGLESEEAQQRAVIENNASTQTLLGDFHCLGERIAHRDERNDLQAGEAAVRTLVQQVAIDCHHIDLVAVESEERELRSKLDYDSTMDDSMFLQFQAEGCELEARLKLQNRVALVAREAEERDKIDEESAHYPQTHDFVVHSPKQVHQLNLTSFSLDPSETIFSQQDSFGSSSSSSFAPSNTSFPGPVVAKGKHAPTTSGVSPTKHGSIVKAFHSTQGSGSGQTVSPRATESVSRSPEALSRPRSDSLKAFGRLSERRSYNGSFSLDNGAGVQSIRQSPQQDTTRSPGTRSPQQDVFTRLSSGGSTARSPGNRSLTSVTPKSAASPQALGKKAPATKSPSSASLITKSPSSASLLTKSPAARKGMK